MVTGWRTNSRLSIVQMRTAQKAFLVPSHGGSSQRLVPNDKRLETDPSWSADGTKIVFSNSRFGGKDPNSVLKIFDFKSESGVDASRIDGIVRSEMVP